MEEAAASVHVDMTMHEARLLHRVLSSGIIADPNKVGDELRKKMHDAVQRLTRISSEQIDGEVKPDGCDRVSKELVPTVARGADRAASNTNGSGSSGPSLGEQVQ